VEAALEWLRQTPAADGSLVPLERLVRAQADNRWTRLREDSGPVANPREYDLPAQAEELARARWGEYAARTQHLKPRRNG
jgi:hypothetical protein